jgi:hypothetical protein
MRLLSVVFVTCSHSSRGSSSTLLARNFDCELLMSEENELREYLGMVKLWDELVFLVLLLLLLI